MDLCGNKDSQDIFKHPDYLCSLVVCRTQQYHLFAGNHLAVLLTEKADSDTTNQIVIALTWRYDCA